MTRKCHQWAIGDQLCDREMFSKSVTNINNCWFTYKHILQKWTNIYIVDTLLALLCPSNNYHSVKMVIIELRSDQILYRLAFYFGWLPTEQNCIIEVVVIKVSRVWAPTDAHLWIACHNRYNEFIHLWIAYKNRGVTQLQSVFNSNKKINNLFNITIVLL